MGLFDRVRRRAGSDPAAVIEHLRTLIGRIGEQQHAAAQEHGRSFAGRAEVVRAADAQLAALADAFAVAEDGESIADSVARNARRDDDAHAGQYEATAAALRSSQDVLGAAAQQLHDLVGDAERMRGQAAEILAVARRIQLDQLREQVRVLRELERAETVRQAAAFREQHGG